MVVDKPQPPCYNKITKGKDKRKEVNKMTKERFETVKNIIAEMDDTAFEKLNEAEGQYWSLDRAESKRGYDRRRYWLAKIGITLDEWYAWCDC